MIGKAAFFALFGPCNNNGLGAWNPHHLFRVFYDNMKNENNLVTLIIPIIYLQKFKVSQLIVNKS